MREKAPTVFRVGLKRPVNVFKDDMEELIETYLSSSLICFASPV